eukprot:c14382_g1_i1.p1 GENE.c14382_g1_i1~~c14382_g1_i1.p1  ORF type:complete len:307 (-),score=131.34 c14382_g1_i1:41-916(-)
MSQALNQVKEAELAYNRRDLIIYALGIGAEEQRFIYEKDKEFAAFPTFPFSLVFKGVSSDVQPFPSAAMSKIPSVGLKGVKVGLDGERYMEKVNDLPTAQTSLVLRSKLIGVHKRGKGALVEVESELIGKDNGVLYYRMGSGAFMVGATDFEDFGTSRSEKLPPPSRQPDKVSEVLIPKNQTSIYRLSGDYNPLHIEDTFAKRAGFERPIVHGLCTLGYTVRLVLQEFAGSDPKKFKAVKARFSSPVLPGSTIAVEMWKDGDRIWVQTRVKETGKIAISDAYVDLHPAAKL